MGPIFRIIFRVPKNQINESSVGASGGKRRGVRIQGPKPVPCKSMLLKRAMNRKLHNTRYQKFLKKK